MTSCNRHWLGTIALAAAALLPADRAAADPQPKAKDDYGQVVARLEALSPEEKTKILQKKERFDALSATEQDRLRQLHRELTQRQDGDRLFGVLERYNDWLKTLTAAQQAELMGLPIEQRLGKIKELQRVQIQSHFYELSLQLEKEDIETIYAWMEDFVTRRQDEILAKIDPRFAAQIIATPSPQYRRYLLVRTVFAFRRSANSQPPVSPTDADLTALAAQLSPTLKFELVTQKTDENRRSLVMTCARYAVYARYAPPPPSDEELSRFYSSKLLSPEDRERVEKLEPRQMKRELIQLYNRNRFRGGKDRAGQREPQSGGQEPPPPPAKSKVQGAVG